MFYVLRQVYIEFGSYHIDERRSQSLLIVFKNISNIISYAQIIQY